MCPAAEVSPGLHTLKIFGPLENICHLLGGVGDLTCVVSTSTDTALARRSPDAGYIEGVVLCPAAWAWRRRSAVVVGK